MKASEIISRARRLIQDETNVRWPLVELSTWLNDAQREIVLQKPSALSESRVLSLQSGTWQTLPEDAISLLKIVRNITAVSGDGARTGGRSIRIVQRDILDSQQADWHSGATVRFDPVVKHYVYDEEDTKSFYVYPGNNGAGKVEAVLSIEPPVITVADEDDEEDLASYDIDLALPAIYANALVDFVCYRAYSKDTNYASSQRAAAHYQQFANSIGIKANQEALNSPNVDAGIKSVPTVAR